jgi:hypothetical protein
MLKILHSFVLCLIFFFVGHSKPLGEPNTHFGSRVRLHLGPALGFYSINPNHAADPKQKFNFLIGVNKEFSLSRDYKSFLLVGVDYFFHGLGFKSYYFPPDTLQLYDKNFQYDYSLQVNELQLPLQFKYLFKPEHNSLFSPYLCVAYHLRYLMPSKLKVSYYGNVKKEEEAELKFKTPLFGKKTAWPAQKEAFMWKPISGIIFRPITLKRSMQPLHFTSTAPTLSFSWAYAFKPFVYNCFLKSLF